MSPRLAALAAVIALMATACLRSETMIRIEEDGSGEIESLVALDIDAAMELNSAFEVEGVPSPSEDELCTQFEQEQSVPEGAEVTPYREDGFCGFRYRVRFGPDQLGQAMAESGSGDFELRRDGDGWYFEADVTDDALGGDDATAAFFGDELFDAFEVSLGVLLPGRLVEHNASYIDTDGTAVWEIDLSAGDRTLVARTEPGERLIGSGSPGEGSGNTPAVVFAIVALLALVGASVWLIRRRRQQRDEVASAVLAGGVDERPVDEAAASSLPPPR